MSIFNRKNTGNVANSDKNVLRTARFGMNAVILTAGLMGCVPNAVEENCNGQNQQVGQFDDGSKGCKKITGTSNVEVDMGDMGKTMMGDMAGPNVDMSGSNVCNISNITPAVSFTITKKTGPDMGVDGSVVVNDDNGNALGGLVFERLRDTVQTGGGMLKTYYDFRVGCAGAMPDDLGYSIMRQDGTGKLIEITVSSPNTSISFNRAEIIAAVKGNRTLTITIPANPDNDANKTLHGTIELK